MACHCKMPSGPSVPIWMAFLCPRELGHEYMQVTCLTQHMPGSFLVPKRLRGPRRGAQSGRRRFLGSTKFPGVKRWNHPRSERPTGAYARRRLHLTPRNLVLPRFSAEDGDDSLSTSTAPCFAIRVGERSSRRLFAPPQGPETPRLKVIVSVPTRTRAKRSRRRRRG